MPVDLSIPNSILGAYLQGRQLRERIENKKTDEAFRQKKLAADVQQFEQQLKSQQDFHNAQLELQRSAHDVAKFQAKNAFLESIGQGRIKGGTFTGQGDIPQSVAEQGVVNQSPEQSIEQLLNMQTGQKFTAPEIKTPINAGPLGTISPNEFQTPTEYGQATYEAQRPKTEATQKAKITELTLKNTLDLIKGKQLEDFKATNRQAEIGLKHIGKMEELAQLGKDRIKAAARKLQVKEPKIVSNSDLINLNEGRVAEGKDPLPFGVTQDEVKNLNIIPQKPLTSTQQAKVAALEGMKSEYAQILEIGKKTGFSAHQAPLTGTGITGIVGGDIGGKLKARYPGEDSQDLIDYRTKLGSVNAERFHQLYGSAVTGGEIGISAGFMPNLNVDPKVAASRILQAYNAVGQQIKAIKSGTNPASRVKQPETGTGRIAYPQINKAGHKLNEEISKKLGKPVYE